MRPPFPLIARIVRLALGAGALVIVGALVAAAAAAYLVARGSDPGLIRRAAALLGSVAAGQHTERLRLDVRLDPAAGVLEGEATLSVRVTGDSRRRLYFLLNAGLAVEAVAVRVDAGTRTVRSYRLGWLLVVDAGQPLPADAPIEIGVRYAGRPRAGLEDGAPPVTAAGVILEPWTFWYPNDLQGFFLPEVTVTAPSAFALVQNGEEVAAFRRGDDRVVRWTARRPVAGLALVAGRYTFRSDDSEAPALQVALDEGIDLDPVRVAGVARSAHAALEARFGPSGFPRTTLFVSRGVRRPFNDGAGLIGLPLRAFRAGDYGLALVAHELSHNWWGGTVSERWLAPGTGGAWILEGFAGLGTLVAVESLHGPEAAARRRGRELFDPDRPGVLAAVSTIDNALAEDRTRDTLYRKGALVAWMLRGVLGDEAFFAGLRTFLETHRYRQVTADDLQRALETASGRSLEAFFSDWVRSARLADLALDGTSPREATLQNLGDAAVEGPVTVWRLRAAGPPGQLTAAPGDVLPLDEGEELVADPWLAWADVRRENNRYPRRADPVHVAPAAGSLAVTRGEPYPWSPTLVERIAADGTRTDWALDRGLTRAPAWMPDGSTLLLSVSDARSPLPAVVTLSGPATRNDLGFAAAPAPAPDGTIWATDGRRLVRRRGTRWETVVDESGWAAGLPAPAPDGRSVAYVATRDTALEIRVLQTGSGTSRTLLRTDRDRVLLRWAPDSSRLYAVTGGSWDWRVLEIPATGEPVRELAAGAAAINALAVSPDGASLALAAVPSLDDPAQPRRLFVLDVSRRQVRTIDLPGHDVAAVAWEDDDTLLCVTERRREDIPWHVPGERTLTRVSVSTGGVTGLP